MRSKWILGSMVAVLFLAVLFFAARPTGGSADVDEVRAAELVEAGIRVVDVRTPAEYRMSHITGAENVPLDALEAAASGWDPAEPVLVYCATGERSAGAKDLLVSAGFEEVYNLAQGVIAWEGDLVAGGDSAAAVSAPSGSGLPVVYEFYTDW